MPPKDEAANKTKKHYSRGQHRSSSHDLAHAQAPAPLSAIPAHPLVPREEAAVVTTDEQLTELIEHLRSAGRFAYDSEFIGEMTYVPKLCVIQVASAQRVALIDPLAEADLRPFWELICDPSVEKIVHSGQQDVEPVIRHLGREPQNIFDTQIVAGFVGMAYPISLSRLVMEIVGVQLGKGLTFTHWDQRPLSAMQLRYAADDVRYLPAVHAALAKRLEELGHSAWAREECQVMCDASRYGFDPESQYLRVRGASSLGPQGLAILRELTIWRDAAARAHDLPPRSFLRDEVLADLARTPVKAVEKLNRVRGLPKPIEHAHGAEIVEATLAALATPQDRWPKPRQSDELPGDRFRADALWAAAQCLCSGQSIDPNLVSSRAEIGELYRALVNHGKIENLNLMRGWRFEAVGKALVDLMQRGEQVHLSWQSGSLKAEAIPHAPR